MKRFLPLILSLLLLFTGGCSSRSSATVTAVPTAPPTALVLSQEQVAVATDIHAITLTDEPSPSAAMPTAQGEHTLTAAPTKAPTAAPTNSALRFVTADDVRLRQAASTSSPILQELKKNACVTLLSVSGDWSRVAVYGGGAEGFIASRYLTGTAPAGFTPSTHRHSYTVTEVPATCTACGYQKHVCSCGDCYQDHETPPLGHDLSYRDNGSTHTVTCSRCSYYVTAAHSYSNGVCLCGKKKPGASTVAQPELSAARACLITLDGTVLYSKNAATVCAPASLTKMMTLLVASELLAGQESKYITVTAEGVDVPDGSSVAGLQAGDKLTVNDLYYAMMLPSGNDAAKVLAIACCGSEAAFVRQMNSKAASLGMKNTHFANCHGITASGHYSTATDLARLACVLVNRDALLQVFSTYRHTATVSGKKVVYTNTHPMLTPSGSWYDSGVQGIKTGYTSAAGNCLATYYRKNGIELISVVLGASGNEQRSRDTRTLLDYGIALNG